MQEMYRVGGQNGEETKTFCPWTTDMREAINFAHSLFAANPDYAIRVYRQSENGAEEFYAPILFKPQIPKREVRADMEEFEKAYKKLPLFRTAATISMLHPLDSMGHLRWLWGHYKAIQNALRQKRDRDAIMYFMQLHDLLVSARDRYNGYRNGQTHYLNAIINKMGKMTKGLHLLATHFQE